MSAGFSGSEVCTAIGAECVPGWEKIRFCSVITDSRAVEAGSLFIALQGENFDGHTFVAQAIARGAAGVVVSESSPSLEQTTCPAFLVPDTLRAFQELARFHRERFSYPVIAITGSNGKTSTKDMVAAMLSERLCVLKTEANFNNEVGLPKTLLQMAATHQVAVVEMGMRGLGEIAALALIARPTIAIITNVGETHIERLGSIENIALAKSELIDSLPESGLAVLNGDDARVRAMRQKTKARVVTFGLEPGNNVSATEVQPRADAVSFLCHVGQRSFGVKLPVPGIHNVYNALAAITTGLELGLSDIEMAQGLSHFSPGKMRLAIRRIADITVIDDTYNASPLSMAAAIDVLQTFSAERKVAVIGDMLELGSSGELAHRRVGEHLARIKAGLIVAVGPLSRFAAATAKENGVPLVFICETHEEASSLLFENRKPGDVILFKGSRGMHMEKVLQLLETSLEAAH